jgi:DNA-binding MarR family transcriptional regulator
MTETIRLQNGGDFTQKGELNLLLIKVSTTHRRFSAYEFAKRNLSAGQPRMLKYLSQNNGCIQRQIAEECNLEPASVTSVLNSMEKAGLVSRIPVEGDKRALRVWLTEKGIENQKMAEKTFIGIEKECFRGFSKEEKATAKDLLTRIYKNMLEAEKAAGE